MKRAGSSLLDRVDDSVVLRVLDHLMETPWDVVRFGATCRRLRSLVAANPSLFALADPGLDVMPRVTTYLTQLLLEPVSSVWNRLFGSVVPPRRPRTLDWHPLVSVAGTMTVPAGMERQVVEAAIGTMSHLRNLRTPWVPASLPSCLTCLSLNDFEFAADSGLCAALRSCPGLERLDVSGYDSELPGSEMRLADICARAPLGLRALRIAACSMADDIPDFAAGRMATDFSVLAPKRDLLQSLCVQYIPCVSDDPGVDWDASFVARCCPNLTSLLVSLCLRNAGSISGVRSLCALKDLRELSLSLEDTGNIHAIIAELEDFANADGCELFEKIRLIGGSRADLSGFFAGRRCKGQLRRLTLGCWVPEWCSESIVENCGQSLVVAASFGRCSAFIRALLLRPEEDRRLLHELHLRHLQQVDIFGLLRGSMTVRRLEVEISAGQDFLIPADACPNLTDMCLVSGWKGWDVKGLVEISKCHPFLHRITVVSANRVQRPADLPSWISFVWRSYGHTHASQEY